MWFTVQLPYFAHENKDLQAGMIKAVNTPYEIRTVTLSNSCKIAYVDEGKGDKTLVFIHGLSNYALGWRPNIETLKQHYRCIAVDLPGNGFSDRGNHPYTMRGFADCVYEVIQKLKLNHVSLVGHSMGGQVAVTTVLAYPSVCEKLILCAPAGLEEFTPIEAAMYKTSIQLFDMFSSDENSLRKTLHNSFYLFPRQADEMVNELTDLVKAYPTQQYKQMVEACIHGMLYEPIRDRLHEIQQPTLVLFGERDALIPNKILHPVSTRNIAERGTAKIPNAELHMLPQCGHFVQWEKAKEVNYYIDSFMKR